MHNQQLVKQASVFGCAIEEPPILIEDEMQIDSKNNNEGSSSSYTFGGDQYPGGPAALVNNECETKKNLFFHDDEHHFGNCPSYLGLNTHNQSHSEPSFRFGG
jgi:hypothetical protein